MIVAQQCGTHVLHRPVRAPEGTLIRGWTECGRIIEYGSWGVYELRSGGKRLFCTECWEGPGDESK